MPHRLPAIAFLFLILFPGIGEAAPKGLVAAIVHVESGGNPNAKGKAGEIGLMQIKLKTAQSVGYRGSRAGLFHPATNLKYGTKYLDLALRKAKGNLCHAATLYNRGLGARPQKSDYCRKVMAALR